ncbi:PAR14 polymerase, partial [Amia calva]|nr:PAR14 polymerase [Amia calva]
MAERYPHPVRVDWTPGVSSLRNKLQIYFQSKRRSNGGDCQVQQDDPDTCAAVVWFRDEDTRQNVLEKKNHELRIDNRVVKLTVRPQEKTGEGDTEPVKADIDTPEKKSALSTQKDASLESSKESVSDTPRTETTDTPEEGDVEEAAEATVLVIENIDDKMTKEYLEMLVENISHCSAELGDFSVEIIYDINAAVVSFKKGNDVQNFLKQCIRNKMFKHGKLSARPLEAAMSVKVENLPPTDTDFLELYFEREGDIEMITLLDEEKSAIVKFYDQKVAEIVRSKEHLISKVPVNVYPYYESLGTALYGKDRPVWKLPDPFTESIHASLWKFLHANNQQVTLIGKHMGKHFCGVDLSSPTVKFSPLPALLKQRGLTAKHIGAWKENASEAFQDVMSKYGSFECPVNSSVWKMSEKEIRSAVTGAVILEPDMAKGTVAIAGLAVEVDKLRQIVVGVVDRVTKKIEREKNSVTEEVAVAPAMFHILQQDRLKEETAAKYPELILKYEAKHKKLILSGFTSEVFNIKSHVLEHVLHMKQKQVEVHPNVVNFLREVDSEEMSYSLFTSKGISAVFNMQEEAVVIVGKTDEALADAEKKLQTELSFHCIDVEDRDVLRKPEWMQLITSLKKTFNSPKKTVSIRRTEVEDVQNQMVVSGFCDPVNKTGKELSEFINKNTHRDEIVHIRSRAINKFIQDQKSNIWSKIVNNDLNIKFHEQSRPPNITLSGPRVYVLEAMKIFRDLVSSVHFEVLKVRKPGAKKFFEDKQELFESMAMNKVKCVVRLEDEDSLEAEEEEEAGQSLCEVQMSDGVVITVCKADICKYSVDIVVNASNEDLKHIGGLAAALLRAAGQLLQDQCDRYVNAKGPLKPGEAIITDSGRLPCKHVIHAVGPRFHDTDSKRSVCLLKRAVKECLKLAETHNCSSIAIPAISSGIFGFPLDLCTETIAQSVREHCQDFYGDNTLKKIHLVNNDDKTVKAMTAAVQKVFADEAPQQRGLQGKPQPKPKPVVEHRQFGKVERRGAQETIRTKEGLTITLRQGNIQDASTKVIVNTISEDLDLDSGAVSRAILNAAGPELQNLVYEAGSAATMGSGSVLVTQGCSLRSDLVFHVIVPHWTQGKGAAEKAMEGIIKECLKQAEHQKQSSVSFPAIGTGNLGFPKPLVASLMLQQVLKFSSKANPRHLQEVVFLLHPSDTQTVQAFTEEFNKKFKVKPSTSPSKAAPAQVEEGFYGKISSPNLGVHEMKIGGVLLQVSTGDITKESTDVIVNSSNDQFSLKAGVSKAILEAAGQAVETECAQLAAQPHKRMIMTQPGNLQSKKIIHVAGQTDPSNIRETVKGVLQMCMDNNFTSVAFPALGTGQGGADPAKVADAMLDAMVDIASQKSVLVLQTVRVVIFQTQMLPEFYKSMQKKEVSAPPEDKSLWSKVKSFFSWDTNETEENQTKEFVILEDKVDPAIFHICGDTRQSVERAKEWIEDLIIKEQEEVTIDSDMIYNFTPEEHEKIIDLQRNLQVTMKLECNSTQAYVKVAGLTRDVLRANKEIQAMITKIRDDITLKRDAELTKNLVEWQYQEGDKFQAFDTFTNLKLEQALGNQQEDVFITIHKTQFKVFLPSGPAVDEFDKKIEIKRINKTEAKQLDLPKHWDAMTGGQGCLSVVLQAATPEYKEVDGLFKMTCPQHVIQIERIQNPSLWKNYQIRKQALEDKNGHQNNERRLFHGTSEPTIKTINYHGFNRSYAGKNAAAYGNGTYFAVNAKYSAQNTYSVPDAKGQKYMYLVKVLTGDFTNGRPGMIVPPAKSGSVTDLYDSLTDNTANPNMFIIFNDIQAYPEYLITFR